MKKRLLALGLAVCVLVSMMTLPASAATNSNIAIQTARMLGILTADQSNDLDAGVTRVEFARMLTMASAYKDNAGAQSSSGSLFPDVGGGTAEAEYVRIAVQQGWMNGYVDGSFRPNDVITLESACTSVLKLMGYDITSLSGSFPSAQLNKAHELELLDGIYRNQGESMTRSDCAILIYNALTATDANGSIYGTTIGLSMTDTGEVDTATALEGNVTGPFIANEGDTLPYTGIVYRNDAVTESAVLNKNDVYYYSASLNSSWIYTNKAAGRITAVSPNASAPTSVTVAGVTYQIGSSSVAYRISSLSGGGVGQVVTLLLGMNDVVVGIVTGEEVDLTYYGVVQSSTRALTTVNGADVLQYVEVYCTDDVTRTVQVDKAMNFPDGWLVAIKSTSEGEVVEAVDTKSISGTINATARTLGDYKLADDVQIIDSTTTGGGGKVRLDRIDGVTLSSGDVRYYDLNEKGEIARIVLNNVTGDIWTYGCLTQVSNIDADADDYSDTVMGALGTAVYEIFDPSDVLSRLVTGMTSGSLLSDLWEDMTTNTTTIISNVLGTIGKNTSGVTGSLISFVAEGASYTYMVDGAPVTSSTEMKFPVLAGGIGVMYESNGNIRSMNQLMPVQIDRLGPAVAYSGNKKYDMADDMQVYLWYSGVYYCTTLSEINSEDYYLTGWYDNFGCTAGGQIRILIALKKD